MKHPDGGRHAILALTLLGTLYAPASSSTPGLELPSREEAVANHDSRLRCPLIAAPEAFELPTGWVTHDLPGVGVTATLPPGWSTQSDGRVASARSPNGRIWLTLRRGDPGDTERLDRVRRAVELTELGPTDLDSRCEARLTTRLRKAGGWPALRVSVSRRALGEPRRAFALFGSLPAKTGTMTAVVTARWREGGAPPLSRIRRLLSGLRARR